MIKLNEIEINKFRGISDLLLTNIGEVNLIVGDNNCGKTSILEAIQLLRDPTNVNNALRVARIRDSYMGFSRLPIFDNFVSMFPILDRYIEVKCRYHFDEGLLDVDETAEIKILGDIKKVMVDYNELRNRMMRNLRSFIVTANDAEIDEFNGQIISKVGNAYKKTNIRVDKFTGITGRSVSKTNLIKMDYLSPIDHMVSSTFNRIIKNEKYKEICISVLQLFDSDIIDLVLLKSDYPGMAVEYVRNKKTGLMPLSTYGDGIKKVLSIANAIAQSSNGVLLIDEIDTAIHAKYYDDIFKFIMKAAKQYNVQLFITTHSIEAVDGLLKTQVTDDVYNLNDDPIRVITLRKDKELNKTFSRTMTGRDVYINREKFNFEVRI